jgi:hypothetical protein
VQLIVGIHVVLYPVEFGVVPEAQEVGLDVSEHLPVQRSSSLVQLTPHEQVLFEPSSLQL